MFIRIVVVSVTLWLSVLNGIKPPRRGNQSKDRMYNHFYTIYGRNIVNLTSGDFSNSVSKPTKRTIALFPLFSHHHRSINIPEPSTPHISLSNSPLPTHGLHLRPLQLLVLPLVHIPQHERQTDYRQADRGIRAAAGNVPGPVAAGVHVGAVDGGGVGDAVADGDGAGAFDEGTREGVGDPGDDDLVG